MLFPFRHIGKRESPDRSLEPVEHDCSEYIRRQTYSEPPELTGRLGCYKPIMLEIANNCLTIDPHEPEVDFCLKLDKSRITGPARNFSL